MRNGRMTDGRKMTTTMWGCLLSGTLLIGCAGEGVEGNWASDKPVANEPNFLVVDAEGEGAATVHIFRTIDNKPQAAAFEHDVSWTDRGDEIDFEMICTVSPFGECDDEDDISMDCTLGGDGTRMSCVGDGRWRDYDFAWRKR